MLPKADLKPKFTISIKLETSTSCAQSNYISSSWITVLCANYASVFSPYAFALLFEAILFYVHVSNLSRASWCRRSWPGFVVLLG